MLTQSAIDAAEWLRATSELALANCEREPINRSYVAAGQIAWDDCCGMLVVAPERVYRSQIFPQEDTSEEICFDGLIAVQYVVLLVRCVPTVDNAGRAPSEAALQAAYEELLGDAAVIYNAVCAPLPGDWQRSNPAQTFVGAQGGCIGVETRVTLGFEQSQWAICCAEPAPHEPGDAICQLSASCVKFTPCTPLVSTNVQDAICEILQYIDEAESAAQTSFEPCDPLTSTNVQDAICELLEIVEDIPAGPPGPPGPAGDAATITVGSTTTGAPGSPASVTNSGTSSAAILDFVIPEGEQGDPGPPGPPGAGGALGYYGSFYDSTDQTAPINTPTAMLLGTTAEANGVSIVAGSQITFANAGTYDLQFSAQLHHRGGGGTGEQVEIWLAKNGSPLADSNTRVIISNNTYEVAAWDFLLTVAAGDWLEIIWQNDNANIALEHLPAAGGRPAVPSVIATVMQVMYTQVGPQGPSGVVAVNAPITDTGTPGSANLSLSVGAGLQISAGSLVPDFGTTSTEIASGNRGLPTGGTTGQVLAKTSNADYAVSWVANSMALLDSQTFLASTTYSIPAGAQIIVMETLGGGGGGGGGARNTAGSFAGGGGGGGGGVYNRTTVPAILFTSPVTVTVGAGGIGGNGRASSTGSGSNGTIGGHSSFGSDIYGSLGGRLGLGGSSTTSVAGGAQPGAAGNFQGVAHLGFSGAGGGGSSVGGAGPRGFLGAAGGAGGSGVAGGGVASNGPDGGLATTTFASFISSTLVNTWGSATGGGPSGGVVPGGAGASAVANGDGGAGGAGSTSTVGGAGGAGLRGGGGGGGGGATNNDGGRGGDGGSGYVRIWVYG